MTIGKDIRDVTENSIAWYYKICPQYQPTRKSIQPDVSTTNASQVISEVEILILKKNYSEIRFDGKVENKAGEGFLLSTKLYNSTNGASILDPNNSKL